jgi:uncharacterized membrane protein YfcA
VNYKNYVLDLSSRRADNEGMTWLLVTAAGIGVGITFGIFGAGGSAFATPLLALLGVPAPIAVASPLPAMLPASMAGAREYLRFGLLDRRVAKLSVVAGAPAVVAGAALSRVVGGETLLVLSGVLLFGVGIRMCMPATRAAAAPQTAGVPATRTVVVLVAAAAFLTGLLANGGGFLLVPIFVLVLGLTAAQAAGTSMVAVAALTVPTLVAHWALGNIDWAVAAAFALGVIPASIVGARVGRRIPERVARRAFGTVLVAFSVVFLALQV